MKKIMFMVMMFVMMMSFNAFGAEKRSVATYYKDDICGSEYAHEPMEVGVVYIADLSDGRTCCYYLDGDSMKVDINYPNGSRIDDFRVTRLVNDEDSIVLYSYGCTEGAYNYPWID